MQQLTIRTFPDLKAEDLARRLKALAPNLECRVCGGRDFGLVEDPTSNMRTELHRQKIGGGLAETIAQTLVTVICTRCGHIEQFAEAVLDGAKPEEYGTETGNG